MPWRDLVRVLRELELSGEVRGGRFVSGYSGEQYALPEAVTALRAARSGSTSDASALLVRGSAVSNPVDDA
ncbi:MAG: hypothetical protein IPJ77_04895 [Planctomycetes bacterium]|nr:hypothetical protein [Planctomycetota bacterium]